MNADQEKTWKAISKTELTLGERIKDASHTDLDYLDNREIIEDLKAKLDGGYILEDIKRLTNPHTFEPVTVIRLIRKAVKK